MRIEGFDVTYLSSYDGLPVKNHLPVELRERFKTENQWLESGYVLVVIFSASPSLELMANALLFPGIPISRR